MKRKKQVESIWLSYDDNGRYDAIVTRGTDKGAETRVYHFSSMNGAITRLAEMANWKKTVEVWMHLTVYPTMSFYRVKGK